MGSTEARWLTCAKRLHALSANGLHYAADTFDRERYTEIEAIALTMLSDLASTPVATIRTLVPTAARGYATPIVDVRGALVEDGELLLVREAADGRWALPGGFADIGLTPAQNIEREFWEEAGLRVSAKRVYGIRHKAAADYAPDVRDFYKVFFLCERTQTGEARAGTDTTAVGFFRREALPSLSRGRTIERDIEAAFAAAANPSLETSFD